MPDLSPADVRETVALVAMKFRAEMDDGDWPDGKCREMLAYITEEHSGDCTKQPWTCGRCEAESAYKQADMLLAQYGLAALIQSQAKRIEELEGAVEPFAKIGREKVIRLNAEAGPEQPMSVLFATDGQPSRCVVGDFHRAALALPGGRG